MARGIVPVNTENSTRWAFRTVENRRVLVPGDAVPKSLLEYNDAATVNKHLDMFVLENQKADWTKYTQALLDHCLVDKIIF